MLEALASSLWRRLARATAVRLFEKMCNWRLCLQIVLFLLIVFWAYLCVKLSYDWLRQHAAEAEAEAGPSTTPGLSGSTGPRSAYELLDGQTLAGERLFDNGYSSRLVDLIYRNAMRATNDRRCQREFEQRVAAAHRFMELVAAATADGRTARIRRISVDDIVPVSAKRSINAADLVAADDYNLAHYTERPSQPEGRVRR